MTRSTGAEGPGPGRRANDRAILLTPPGAGAIAVVRLAGNGVGPFLRKYFDKSVVPGRCVHGTLSEGGRVLDDPVVVSSEGGRVADLCLHGGPWVVQSVLDLARRHGFDVVEPGALPLHETAVEGADVISTEVAQYLPLAGTELALRALLAQPAAWEQFSADGPSPEVARRMVADRSLYWLLHPPRVAIVGVPNVGKSTLANQLFARERVITADVPGTTRDWVGELANLDGLAVMLVDTPGLHDAPDAIEREAIDRSREQVAAADLLVLVLDPTQPREPGQAALERAYPDSLRVVNKSDRPRLWDDRDGVRTVATAGEGVDEIRRLIKRRFLASESIDVALPRWWTARQYDLLAKRASGAGAFISET